MRYLVAAEGEQAILFFDDEDEFGTARMAPVGAATRPELVGDLLNAVRAILTMGRGVPP